MQYIQNGGLNTKDSRWWIYCSRFKMVDLLQRIKDSGLNASDLSLYFICSSFLINSQMIL